MEIKQGYRNSFLFSLRDDDNFVILKCIQSNEIRIYKKEDTDNYKSFCNFGMTEIYLQGRKGCVGTYGYYYEVPPGTQ